MAERFETRLRMCHRCFIACRRVSTVREPRGYDRRALKGMGLAYAVSDRGGCHLRATVYKAEFSGAAEPSAVEGKAKLVLDYEDRHTMLLVTWNMKL